MSALLDRKRAVCAYPTYCTTSKTINPINGENTSVQSMTALSVRKVLDVIIPTKKAAFRLKYSKYTHIS